jgi:hypothetical protein
MKRILVAVMLLLPMFCYAENQKVFNQNDLKKYSNQELINLLSHDYLEKTFIQPEDGYEGVSFCNIEGINKSKTN